MRLARLALPLFLAASVLSSCAPQDKGHATPEAAEELALISTVLPEIGIDEILELPAADEIHLLMADFASTADAGLASTPSGITMLHLACLFKKPELARCLLLDKADPNATTAQGDTPLALAVAMRGAEDDTVTAETVIRLIDVLISGGADITRHTAEDMASGVRKLLNADVAVSVTGLAGPTGDEFGHPVGTVYIGFESASKAMVKHCSFAGSREEIRTQTIQAALELILDNCP